MTTTPTGSQSAASTNRILVIDDEEIVLVGLRETLRREGYDVMIGSNALAGLEALKTGPFSVVITDQQMPYLTGLEFLSQVKEIQPNASRILITAVLSLETVVEAINKGEIYRFIIKPWLREELLATVKNAVQRYELFLRQAELEATTSSMNQRLTDLNHSLEEQVKRVADQNQQLLQLNGALEENLQHSVRLCLHVMQTFYPTLGSQARRVFELCKAMSGSLSLSADDCRTLEISSWLYDVGLVGVPRDIIRRWQQEPDSLNEAERSLIEQHPVLGQELVQFVHHLEKVGPVIRAHHERFDGSGYPDKLDTDRIPWLARLLAVAVSFSESNHPNTEAVEAIKLASGMAFDPDAVRAFLRVLPKADIPRKQRQVLLSELRPGMILAKGIYTANGMLLIPEGQPLSALAIDKVLNHNRIQPISHSLVVFC
jgi:response regulator RpfG family c-di-GMP phosphodiesterase